MNAFEHGCLGMGADKQRLILEGEYDALIMAAETDSALQITLTLTLLPRQGRLQVWLELADPGPGFDVGLRVDQCRMASAPCGRGFRMMKRSVGLVRRNVIGNRLVLMQMFDSSTSPGSVTPS